MLDQRFNLIINIPIILFIFADLLKPLKCEYSLNIVIQFLSFALQVKSNLWPFSDSEFQNKSALPGWCALAQCDFWPRRPNGCLLINLCVHRFQIRTLLFVNQLYILYHPFLNVFYTKDNQGILDYRCPFGVWQTLILKNLTLEHTWTLNCKAIYINYLLG